ncbi:hypothetical protein [Arthrobacter pascens]|uniref:hypothetical protein n=1 Tax=Arthrobacter pascens TaxID=1677 RepID=UPI00196B0095|nr:hypothetical protein [Arthrobacter pascens]MBN3496379.1 hypothetical protein [Arthrobacter pascens]
MLIGVRSAEELAGSNVETLTPAARAAGVKSEEVRHRHLHSLAFLVSKLARTWAVPGRSG